ncbi:MAG TPA: methyltransferase domain-containing protein [Candidatus Angelobacter sp.]
MQRVVTPELLDRDAGTAREVQASLRDLRMVNRWFGGARTTLHLLRRVTQRCGFAQLRWLDVGGASGDVAALVEKSMAAAGVESQATILDRVPTHLNGAHPSVCADALALPFADNSFDVVASSLFVHHLEPEELAMFIREALRVARHALVINDLVRHPAHLALVYAGYPLYRSRLTRHDSVASVRRAYTVDEMKAMLERAGTAESEIGRSFLFRMGAIVWKQQQLSTT